MNNTFNEKKLLSAHVYPVRSAVQAFRNTRFFPSYRRQFLFSLLLPGVTFLLFLLCAFRGADGLLLFAFLTAFLLILFLWALYWSMVYRLVICQAPSLEEIEHRYSLLSAESQPDYQGALHNILKIADKSIEQEYSIRLLQRQAELDAMKSQINPHFLYNTLDTIRGYAMMENAQITGDMIEVLSRLFRYTVSRKKTEVTLSEEISILYDYIKIQEYRTNQRIIVIQNTAAEVDTDHYRIPRMVLQPLVENAVLHGSVGITHDFTITLSIYPTNYYLVISVKDNGCGMTPEVLAAQIRKLSDNSHDAGKNGSGTQKPDGSSGKGSGVALSNINQRIKIIYGEQYGLRAYSVYGEGSEFQLLLPLCSDPAGSAVQEGQQGGPADEN